MYGKIGVDSQPWIGDLDANPAFGPGLCYGISPCITRTRAGMGLQERSFFLACTLLLPGGLVQLKQFSFNSEFRVWHCLRRLALGQIFSPSFRTSA